MMLSAFSAKIYSHLLTMASKGIALRHSAYFLAGLVCIFVAPPLQSQKAPPSGVALVGGLTVVVAGLMLAGAILNVLRPLLSAAGQLPMSFWAAFVLATFFHWRYTKGRGILLALASERRN